MNLKNIFTVCFIFLLSISLPGTTMPQNDFAAGDYLAVPYFGAREIRFYSTSSETLFSTFNFAAEFVNFPAITFGGPSAGPNGTVIYDGKLFVSFDNNPVGGVLIYNHNDIFPVRNANPPLIIATAPVAGIAIHPVTGDLYVAKFYTGGVSGKITRYTKASGYSAGSAYDLPVPNYWVNYFTGIVFDASNNLWTGNLDEHRLICFTASSNYDNFYVIGNGPTPSYSASVLTGGTATVHLLSAPEGFARDNTGNVWFSNNNDWSRANNPGEGTFGRIDNTYIPYLMSLPISGSRAAPNVISLKTISQSYIFLYYVQDAKFGGMTIKGNTLYLSDQGNTKVWMWDKSSPFNTTNFVQAGTITAAYPGFGGLSVNDISFPIGISTISNNIPEKYSVSQNYPNPFNPATSIKFNVAIPGDVKIAVYDIMGREVQTLVNESLMPGTYETTFDGSMINSGVYFYRVTAGNFSETRKMLLIK